MTRLQRGDDSSTQENAESWTKGWERIVNPPFNWSVPQGKVILNDALGPMVDETPTKHWTTIVVIPGLIFAECRCGWVEESDENRPRQTQIEQASAAARDHKRKASGDASYDG